MTRIIFVDTSVLLCILDVPGKNQDRDAVVRRFADLATAGSNTLILPVAAVIETGNHIAHLSDGSVRRTRMEKLARILQDSATATAPWVVGRADWNAAFLQLLIDGSVDGSIPSMVDLSSEGVGVGDASIVHEMQKYQMDVDTPSGMPVRLWTLDNGLAALTPTLT